MSLPETVIDVLDSVFEGRDFDLSILDDAELTKLSEKLTTYASNYTAPTREPGKSRFYCGGTIWSSNTSNTMIAWGPAGLANSANADVLQTLCLAHDSVVCHDVLTDLLSSHTISFLPSFYTNIKQGEVASNETSLIKTPITQENRNNIIRTLNPILRIYDLARRLIQQGFLIPVPTRIAMQKYKTQILTQMRYAHQDPVVKTLAAKEGSIAVKDDALSLFVQPGGGTKLRLDNAIDNPALRLHYGMIYHLKCLAVAYVAGADFTPTDDFGWEVLDYKYEELYKLLTKKSKSTFHKYAAQSALMIPIVTKFAIEDIVSIRTNEDIFEELRNLLRNSIESIDYTTRSMSELYRDYEMEMAEALTNWKSQIDSSGKRKGLFKDLALVASSAIEVGASLIFLADTPAAIIASAAGLPGIYYGLKDLLFAGCTTERALLKILRKYKW